MIICINWFSNNRLTFHSEDKPHLVMICYVLHCWVCFAKFTRESGLFSCNVCFYCQSSAGLTGFPRWCSGKAPSRQFRGRKRRGFDPWVGTMPWRRKCQHTPAFLPGAPRGQRSLVGPSSWGCRVRLDCDWAPRSAGIIGELEGHETVSPQILGRISYWRHLGLEFSLW